MIKVAVADITLREYGGLSFKEKIEIAKILDKLNVDVIETAPVKKGRTDILFLHTIAPLFKNSVLCCPVNLDGDSVRETYEAIKSAKHPRLLIPVPVSVVQMEYLCHKKPKAMIQTVTEVLTAANDTCCDVEVSLIDATRADKKFLAEIIKLAISNGVKCITVCDTAGGMLPSDFEEFLSELQKDIPEISDICLSVECSNSLNMATACAISCIKTGVRQIKTAVDSVSCSSLSSVSQVFREKSDSLGISTAINTTVLDNSVNKIRMMISGNQSETPFDGGTGYGSSEDFFLSEQADIASLKTVISRMGYELSEEDISRVYEEFVKLSKNKEIGAKELDMIIASVAMQVKPTYKLVSYVINNGNIITPTACIELERSGEIKRGICIGDGPIDAAFLAIESITGHHFELDNFNVSAVTEGREAIGSAMVKLRYDGKSYSGRGVSTDIIGASIKAYINALNKICFEEEGVRE